MVSHIIMPLKNFPHMLKGVYERKGQILSSVQFRSVAQSCPTLATPWIAARQQIARRNINHLRYADDTTLMAESVEETNYIFKNCLHSRKEVLHFGSTFFFFFNWRGKIRKHQASQVLFICPWFALKHYWKILSVPLPEDCFLEKMNVSTVTLCSHLIHLSTCKLLKKERGMFCFSHKLSF